MTPGIISISYAPCSALPIALAYKHSAHLSLRLGSVATTPISFCGHPECVAKPSSENNGITETATLTFRTTEEMPPGGPYAFFITTASGKKYVIGTREDIPVTLVATDVGTPATTPAVYTIEVTLKALKALIPYYG